METGLIIAPKAGDDSVSWETLNYTKVMLPFKMKFLNKKVRKEYKKTKNFTIVCPQN